MCIRDRNQTKSPSSSAASTPPATPPPTPPPQQQSWRPRNPQSNQRFSGQGQQQRLPAFQPRTFQSQTGRFPAPRFQNALRSPRPWRPPGPPRVFVPSNSSGTARATAPGTCYVCGTLTVHRRNNPKVCCHFQSQGGVTLDGMLIHRSCGT